jgi:hypothetical protein
VIPSVSAWLPYMSASVCHKPRGGQDDYGAPTSTSTGVWYPAHIEQAVSKLGGAGGLEVVTAGLHIIIGAIVAIDPQDTLLIQRPFTARGSTGAFSTGDEAQMVRVASVIGPLLGHHHTEVWTE